MHTAKCTVHNDRKPTSATIEAMLRVAILTVLGASGVLSIMGQGQQVVCPGMEILASAESMTRVCGLGNTATFPNVRNTI